MIEQLELIPQNTIRIETALSRFPVHKLAKRGNIDIEISERNSAGELRTKWEVTYNNKLGQPGPLAYKVDTLIVNRRIDDERPLIPKVIKLGSLSEVCRELGIPASGKNTNHVKRALMQNASAFINAKITFKATDGAERTVEAGFSRYSVILTGERLPDGRRANAVYLILNDVYMKVLNEAQTRPLDYDYPRGLTPAAQRFYELIGFQIYAVLKHEAEQVRQRRREALQPAYYDFLRAREGEHRNERREAYSAFLEWETGQRAEIEDSRVFKPKFKAHQLEIFDQKESHLDRLREHFQELTLDEWLEQNPDPS